jgi:hypothetical protein
MSDRSVHDGWKLLAFLFILAWAAAMIWVLQRDENRRATVPVEVVFSVTGSDGQERRVTIVGGGGKYEPHLDLNVGDQWLRATIVSSTCYPMSHSPLM